MNRPAAGATRLVYSTELGRVCPDCRAPVADCRCKALAAAQPRGDGRVRISRETQRRGGKVVTVVRGLPLDEAALAALGKRLRSACGAGGSAKDGALEIQGEHLQRVADLLAAEGWSAQVVTPMPGRRG